MSKPLLHHKFQFLQQNLVPHGPSNNGWPILNLIFGFNSFPRLNAKCIKPTCFRLSLPGAPRTSCNNRGSIMAAFCRFLFTHNSICTEMMYTDINSFSPFLKFPKFVTQCWVHISRQHIGFHGLYFRVAV